jgi:hypothetical protein
MDVVIASMEGFMMPFANPRTKIHEYIAQEFGLSSANNAARPSVEMAIIKSAMNKTAFLLHRSMNAPAIGPRKICGNKLSSIATLKTVADSVVLVKYQIKTKEANWLPRSVIAWLDQSEKYGVAHLGFIPGISNPAAFFDTLIMSNPHAIPLLAIKKRE